jgi:hypothetical protein
MTPHADARGLLRALQAAARGDSNLTLATFDDRLIRWAVKTGLGPLLLHATVHDPEAVASPLWPLLKGADLSARMLTARQIDATTELIDACQGRTPPLVLLKGISICEQHYPEAHLRPMRDVDILVEDDAVPAVEAILLNLGYRPDPGKPAEHYQEHHHGPPLVHADTGVWVEVHRALCSRRSGLDSEQVLGRANVETQLQASLLRGRPVRRLSDELQIVYLACHWADALQRVASLGALGSMVALVDLMYLLKHHPDVQWSRILAWTEGSVAGRYVHLLLAYLHTRRVIDIPSEVLRRLHPRHGLRGVALTMIHALIDRYVVDGRDFGPLLSERHFTRIWRALVLRQSLTAFARRRWHDDDEHDSARANEADAPSAAPAAPLRPALARSGTRLIHPRRRSDVAERMIGGELVILDTARRLVHTLNRTARYIWVRCDGDHDVLDITVALARDFGIAHEAAARDVEAAVQQFEAVGLLESEQKDFVHTRGDEHDTKGRAVSAT